MIFKIAWTNFYRQGIRAFLNTLITALTLIALIFMVSLFNGFQAQATHNLVITDVGGGHYRAPGFDILTPTEWEDKTRPVPSSLAGLPRGEKAEVLIQQGQLFPNRRLYPVQLRGVEMGQTLLQVPLAGLESFPAEPPDVVPVVVGTKMASRTRLEKGDTVILKFRDRFGVVDAREVVVVDVADIVNPRLDEGVVWLRIDHLRKLTRREGEITWVAVDGFKGPVSGFEFHTPEMLMSDLLTLLRYDRRNAKVLMSILLFLTGISIFNSQFLNVFKRQKEIGTLMALGMEARRIVRLFTLEGSLAAVGAIFLGALLGIPLFLWFQSIGLDVSHLSEATMPVREKIFLEFRPVEIVSVLTFVVALMVFVAWLPVRKIAGLDATLALRGRAIT